MIMIMALRRWRWRGWYDGVRKYGVRKMF